MPEFGVEKDLAVLLARIDERTRSTQETLRDVKLHFVTQAEFQPVKRLVFAGVGLILTSVVGALVALVVVR